MSEEANLVETFDEPLIITDEFGRRYINREKLGESFFALRMDDYPLSVASSRTGSSSFSIPEDAGHAGDFEIAGFVGYSTVPFRISISEVGVEANAFMSNPIHHSLAFGMGGLPFVLAETIFLIAGKSLQVQVTNISTATTASVRLVAFGRRFNNEMSVEVRERRAKILADRPTRPFWLTLDNTTIALSAGASNQEAQLTIPSGSHFACDDILACSTRPFEVQLFDAQSGRPLTFGITGTNPGFIDSRILCGSGFLPAKTIGSPILQPRRSIRAVFNDLGNNGTNTVHFTLHGRRMRVPVG